MNDRIRKLCSSTGGSFTLEASTVFPLLFGALFLYFIVALYLFQQGVFYSGAVMASEAVAFHWDNSRRDAASGLPPAGEDDGLYWRLTEDGLLRGMMNMGQPAESISAYPLDRRGAVPYDLPAVKLAKAGDRLNESWTGEMRYLRGVHGMIETRLYPSVPIDLPGGRKIGAAAKAQPSDPVEFIRSIDLVRYYTAKFRTSEDISPDKAGKVLQNYGGAQ
ncbi:hypothetical protein [Paenibacillus humicus]|uniref:hypothetical protein n=1 Tax=Paenibacillus humicus TaxID=412861 RepID=UPI003F17D92C